VARTEHGLAVINGIPSVVGGVAATEFLASVEQLDDTNNRDMPYQREWRISPQVLDFILNFFIFASRSLLFSVWLIWTFRLFSTQLLS
jgi:hypothetical protein